MPQTNGGTVFRRKVRSHTCIDTAARSVISIADRNQIRCLIEWQRDVATRRILVHGLRVHSKMLVALRGPPQDLLACEPDRHGTALWTRGVVSKS